MGAHCSLITGGPRIPNSGLRSQTSGEDTLEDTLERLREAAHTTICTSRTQVSLAMSIVGRAWQALLRGWRRLAEASGPDARVSCFGRERVGRAEQE